MSPLQDTPANGVAGSGEAAVADLPSAVRRALQEHAPCETGYPGLSTCKICAGGAECADALQAVLVAQQPDVDWAPAIRQVLGLW